MNGNKEELKPCPFCGQIPETRWDYKEFGYEEGYNIKCCFVYIKFIFKEDAIDAWNKRV